MFVMLMFMGTVFPALAVAGKSITIYPGVNIYIDDQKFNPTDANGNPVEVFAYNGTTYLPVRAISKALGKPIQWESDTNSVYVGKHTGNKPAMWLSDLDYFEKEGYWTVGEKTKDNLGIEHEHSIDPTFSNNSTDFITYKINSQYSVLTGVLYWKYEGRDADPYMHHPVALTIYGDGKTLWSGNVNNGIDPIEFSVNLTNISELKFVCSGYLRFAALGDVGLWT